MSKKMLKDKGLPYKMKKSMHLREMHVVELKLLVKNAELIRDPTTLILHSNIQIFSPRS